MILDSVSVVVRYDKVKNEDGSSYHNATFLPEYVYYGHGSASDAMNAIISAEVLNNKYKTAERYYQPIRMDYEDAVKEGLIKT